LKTKLV